MTILSPFVYFMALNHIVAGGNADQCPDRRIKTHRLLDDLPGVGELRHLIPGRLLVAADFVRLGADLVRNLRILGKQIERTMRA